MVSKASSRMILTGVRCAKLHLRSYRSMPNIGRHLAPDWKARQNYLSAFARVEVLGAIPKTAAKDDPFSALKQPHPHLQGYASAWMDW